MSPVIGTIASSTRQGLATNSFESIQTQIVANSTTSQINFNSIPSTYKHLQIRYTARTSRTSSDGDYIRLRFNSDTGSNYSTQHWLGGNGAGATGTYAGYDGASGIGMYVERLPNAAQLANSFGIGIIDIIDYTSTGKNKTMHYTTGADVNGTFNTYNVRQGTNMWLNNTTAVSSITIDVGVGPYFIQNSHFALYGIKG